MPTFGDIMKDLGRSQADAACLADALDALHTAARNLRDTALATLPDDYQTVQSIRMTFDAVQLATALASRLSRRLEPMIDELTEARLDELQSNVNLCRRLETTQPVNEVWQALENCRVLISAFGSSMSRDAALAIILQEQRKYGGGR